MTDREMEVPKEIAERAEQALDLVFGDGHEYEPRDVLVILTMVAVLFRDCGPNDQARRYIARHVRELAVALTTSVEQQEGLSQ